MFNPFELLRESIDILDVAERYGIEVDRYGKALCFIHEDRNPSLSFYKNRFRCFACEESGSVLDMVAILEGVSILEAAQILSDQYGLGLFDKPYNAAEHRHRAKAAAAERERLDAFEEWCIWAANIIAGYLRLLDDVITHNAPDNSFDWNTPFVEAINSSEYWSGIYDAVFVNGGFEEKTRFYKNSAQEVWKIAGECFAPRKIKTA